MRNILKSLFIATVTLLSVTSLAAKDPSSTLDIKDAAAGNTYYTLDATPDIKNLDWVGYNSTGSGTGGCVTESHWKLSSSRTLTFKVKNCTKIEAKDAYFSKDATTELKYSVNGSTAVAFATNGDLKKTCASGSFETGNTGEITVVLSADNDIVLNNILFYSGEGSENPGGGGDPTPGGGDDPTPGGGDDPVSDGVLIKGTAQQEVSGPAAGSIETNLKKKDAVKLDAEKYFGLKLDNGYTLQEGDVFVISTTTPADLGRCMIYADNEGNDLIYDEGVEYSTDNKSDSGEKRIVLPAEANGKTAIYLWRGVKNEAPQWNVTFDFLAVEREGFVPPVEPEKSNDATLKSLEYYNDGSFVSVPGFAPDKFSYSIVLPADYVGGAPSIQAEQNDEKANIDVSQASTLPGTAKVVVTAEDGTKKTYTVDFSKASDDPTPGGGDDPQPSGNVYAHWRFSGSDIPAVGSSESGTKMTVEFLAKDDSKEYNTESASYNDAVPDDMKSQGAKGVKFGGNVLYLKVTIDGGFKANDVVTICGYNPWKVSSSDAHEGDVAASVATGTSKTDYNIGSFTLSADAEALYMMRAEGSGTCICAIKVTRGGSGDDPVDPEESHDASLKSLSLEYGGQSAPLPDFSPTKYSYEIPVPAEYAVLGVVPTVLAETSDENATIVITQAEGIPGTATIVVTAEDGTTTLTYSIIFSVEETPGGGDDPQPSGDVYAHWRFSGSDIPAVGSSESGTKMTVEFLAKDDSKEYNTESASYNDAVPDDMKSQGAKGVKFGGNVLYLKVTIDGGFKANDVVTICGYNPWKVSSSDAHEGDVAASVATGTSKTDYNIGSFTLSADAEALYMMRAEGSGTCICAIKVTRGGGGDDPVDPEKSSDNTLKSLTYDGISVPGFSPSVLIYDIELPAETDEVPVVEAEANDEKASVEVNPATSLPGTTSVKVTAENGDVATYKINFTVEGTEPPATIAVEDVTLNLNTLTLNVGYSQKLIATVVPSNATNQNVSWSSDNAAVAIVSSNGIVTAKAVGTATITVTTEDGDFEASCEVTVIEDETPDDPVPSTSLTLHEPGIYEEIEAKGGYETSLTNFGNREYEVYYMTRDAGSNFCIATDNADKTSKGITTLTSGDYSCTANDGWFNFSGIGWSSASEDLKDEFGTMARRLDMDNTCEFTLHIKGYDQFSIVGKDKKIDDTPEQKKPENNRYLEVYIDDVLQPQQFNNSAPTIRRYDISYKEHVIRIRHIGTEKSSMNAFSLRVAQIPSVKYLKGNDSTQVVLQTENLSRPIYYYTKYNKMGETRVIWEGQEATGIDLTVKSSTEIGDTLVLSGKAMCPVGKYPFHVSSFFNGKETKRLPSGMITVASDIRAIGDTAVEVYAGEAMEELTFSYHALDAENDITIDWKGNNPDGISGHGENGTYYISGTPTQEGDYPFTISVKDGNSVNGLIKVLPPIVGDNLVLYLYTNGDRETILAKDGIAALLSTQYTLVPRKAQSSGLRPIADYQKYKWALISEDANANNAEVLALIMQPALPILNMKGFSYADDRLSWGDPNNGSLTENGQYITVQRDDHPIFQTLGWKHGEKIKVLKKIDEKGLMPIDINEQGTFCLATSLSRAKDNYDGDGDPFTFLHEKPAGMSGNTNKYICMPIAMSSSKNLTQDGKDLVESVVNYLLNDKPSVTVPLLQITSFVIDGIPGNIDQANKRITFEIDLKEHFDVDKHAIKPEITVADETYTHVSTKFEKDGYVDFSESWSYPVAYEVSDYINRQVYEVAIRFFTSEGIEDVYAAGDWVNIYDIFGRKVSTTNEDIYHMVLPRGVYVIVTETGQTFKIMR